MSAPLPFFPLSLRCKRTDRVASRWRVRTEHNPIVQPTAFDRTCVVTGVYSCTPDELRHPQAPTSGAPPNQTIIHRDVDGGSTLYTMHV